MQFGPVVQQASVGDLDEDLADLAAITCAASFLDQDSLGDQGVDERLTGLGDLTPACDPVHVLVATVDGGQPGDEGLPQKLELVGSLGGIGRKDVVDCGVDDARRSVRL
jgi:hypothetical protein